MRNVIKNFFRRLTASSIEQRVMREIQVDSILIITNKTGGEKNGDKYVFDDGSYVQLPSGGIVNMGPGYMNTKMKPV